MQQCRCVLAQGGDGNASSVEAVWGSFRRIAQRSPPSGTKCGEITLIVCDKRTPPFSREGPLVARTLVFAVCVGAGLAVCTSVWAERVTGVSGAIAQPFRDLGILRPRPEDALRHAAAAPYSAPAVAPSDPLYCDAIDGELASLDVVLGTDIDTQTQRRRTAGSMASGALSNAIGDVIDLPYRSVIRRITGAERRDRQYQAAIQAGMVRRAFLKGLRLRDCVDQQHAPAPQMTAETTLLAVPVVSDAAFAPAPASPAPAPLQNVAAHVPEAPRHASTETALQLQPVADVTPAG